MSNCPYCALFSEIGALLSIIRYRQDLGAVLNNS